MSSVYLDFCGHSAIDHLCHNFLCNEVTRFERIAAVVFHILTLGIPLVIYHVVHLVHWWCRCCPKVPDQEGLKKTAIQSVKNSYSTDGWKAIEFAKNQIIELRPDPTPEEIKINRQTAQLFLLVDGYFSAFRKRVIMHPADLWSDSDDLRVYDQLMKLAFALSCAAMDALPDFMKKTDKTGVEILNDAGLMRLIGACEAFYLYARDRYVLNRVKDQLEPGVTDLPIGYADKFYQEPLQNSWRQLFNEFCRRAHQAFDAKTLKAVPDIADLILEDHASQ